MSRHLLDLAIANLRAKFTKVQLRDVQPYGGEFSAEEVKQVSYDCPAALLTVLGWHPEPNGGRLSGKYVRRVHMAAFVVTKHAKRELRMAEAMTLAELVSLQLRAWNPDTTGLPVQIAPLEEDATAENLYSRAVDASGQALWVVRWSQCVKTTLPDTELFDLIAVEITDHTLQGKTPAAPAPAPAELVVTEDVKFQPLT